MQPNEALGVAAQLAVSLAGFAGVVVVFRPQSIQQWSQLDRARLHLLLHNSVCPLAYALFSMLLLSVTPPVGNLWRWCSVFALLFQLPGAIVASKKVRAVGKAAYRDSGGRLLFYSISAIGGAALVLQVLNAAWLNLFWPYFFAIVVHLLAGMIQFMRMVMLLPHER